MWGRFTAYIDWRVNQRGSGSYGMQDRKSVGVWDVSVDYVVVDCHSVNKAQRHLSRVAWLSSLISLLTFGLCFHILLSSRTFLLTERRQGVREKTVCSHYDRDLVYGSWPGKAASITRVIQGSFVLVGPRILLVKKHLVIWAYYWVFLLVQCPRTRAEEVGWGFVTFRAPLHLVVIQLVACARYDYGSSLFWAHTLLIFFLMCTAY